MKDYYQFIPPFLTDLNYRPIGVLPDIGIIFPQLTEEIRPNAESELQDLQIVEEAFRIFTDPAMDEKIRGLVFLCGAKHSVWLVRQLAENVGSTINPFKKGTQVRSPISYGGDRNPNRLKGFLSEEARKVVSEEDLVAALAIWFSMKLTSEPACELNADGKRSYLFKDMLYRSVPDGKKQEAFEYFYNLISMSNWFIEQ